MKLRRVGKKGLLAVGSQHDESAKIEMIKSNTNTSNSFLLWFLRLLEQRVVDIPISQFKRTYRLFCRSELHLLLTLTHLTLP